MQEWLQGTNETLRSSNYLGVSFLDWSVLILIALLLSTVLRFAKGLFAKKLEAVAAHTNAHWDDILVRCIKKTHGMFFVLASLYLGASLLGFTGRAESLFHKLFVVGMFFQAALWGNEVLGYGLSRYLAKRYGQKDETVDNLSTYSVIDITAKFVLWTVLFLLLLDNLGVNITALVTGLGIGGIAIALAVQNILGDIFASLTIVMDRPFEVGDFIVVDDKSGTVESVGLKTSRIRALSGEQLVFPNKKLIESYVQNFKRMAQRRVAFSFRVDYDTPEDVLAKIPGMVADIVKSKDNVRFDRAHLAKLGETSLEYEVVYILQSAEYNLHMDIQQDIFLRIIKGVREMKANFSYPTPRVVIDSANVVEGARLIRSVDANGTASAH